MKRLALLLGAATLFAADFAAEGDKWWAHIAFLADDKLQGRDVGSDGYREAAKYVSGKMETFGLKPAGTDGYYQPVKFETRQLVDDESSLTLVRDGEATVLDRADATQGTRADSAPQLEAGMAFVGYGLRVPEAKYDDLAGVDLRGKIAVYVNSTGALNAPGPVKSHVGSASERWKVLKAAGAIGTAVIMNPRPQAQGVTPPPTDGAPAAGGGRGQGAGRGGAAGGRGPQRSFLLADPELQEATGQKVAITITRRGGDRFFEGSGYTMDDILKLAMENKPLPKFQLAGTLRVKAAVKRETLEAPNVAGMLTGSDSKLKNEYVIMSTGTRSTTVRWTTRRASRRFSRSPAS
jgi:hypothetical protein